LWLHHGCSSTKSSIAKEDCKKIKEKKEKDGRKSRGWPKKKAAFGAPLLGRGKHIGGGAVRVGRNSKGEKYGKGSTRRGWFFPGENIVSGCEHSKRSV